MAQKRKKQHQQTLDFENPPPRSLPEQNQFPLNIKRLSLTIGDVVQKDLQEASKYTIITGFTSLSHIIKTFGEQDLTDLCEVRIILGWEPNPRARKKYNTVELPLEIREYWLKANYSIMMGGATIKVIRMIEDGLMNFKFHNHLHAKIYLSESAAIIGSANFSRNGLYLQDEATERHVKGEPDGRFEGVEQIANHFWLTSKEDFDERIIALLKDLVSPTSWQEALARAISEVLEGDWIKRYKPLFKKLMAANLWPSQWNGIARAMSIIQDRNNVLIADPTGSGKTKMCSALILTLIHWLWENGRQDRSNSLVICPPLVISNWQGEFRDLSVVNYSQLSSGRLSKASKKSMRAALEDLKLAHILTIDEAHNYLSQTSNRTKAIKMNHADHMVLATATPINKRAEDLLKLIELLDVDNLNDEDLSLFRSLRESSKRQLEQNDLENLKRFISQFTVRRTKLELNQMIQKDRESYKNRLNKLCKYPSQISKVYETGESPKDIELVEEINDHLKQLKGVNSLKSWRVPEYWYGKPTDEEIQLYIKRRLNAAKGLSVYHVRSALRSSKVAVIEHIEGTEKAKRSFEQEIKKTPTGNILDKIENLKLRVPHKPKTLTRKHFPKWLVDRNAWQKACDNDLAIYKRVLDLTKQISDNREIAKADFLIRLLNGKEERRHKLVLAFDSTIISLHYLKALLEKRKPSLTVFVVTGNNKTIKEEVLEKFALGSEAQNVIALCSDAMSESVNMQQASAVMLLDMPSVLRVAEQRIGRIDRMDSPHESIAAYWPNDSEAYSLAGDQRLVDATYIVDRIFGSNLYIPEELKRKAENMRTSEEFIEIYEEYKKADVEWGGIQDSFKPVELLKEGDHPLISEETYDQLKNVKATVKSKVSFLKADVAWAFFALRGSKEKSPRWFLIEEDGQHHTEFPDVCSQLRSRLKGKHEELEWEQETLDRFVKLLRLKERELLPNKRKRALEVAEALLEKIAKPKSKYSAKMRKLAQELLAMFKPSHHEAIVDYYEFAWQWIELFRPMLIERRKKKRRNQVISLQNLKGTQKIPWSEDDLQAMIENAPYTDSIDGKIAACIIAITDS